MKTLIDKAPKSISKYFIEETHKKNDSILIQGESLEYLYIIISGKVEVLTVSKQGKEILLNTFENGESFGVLEIFNPKLHTQTVSALIDTVLIKLNKEYVFKWMKEDFDFTMYMITLLNEYFYDASNFARNLISLTINERVILAIKTHVSNGTLPSLTKETLMRETGTQKRSLNRAIESLSNKGVILFENKKFKILNHDLLNKLSKSIQ